MTHSESDSRPSRPDSAAARRALGWRSAAVVSAAVAVTTLPFVIFGPVTQWGDAGNRAPGPTPPAGGTAGVPASGSATASPAVSGTTAAPPGTLLQALEPITGAEARLPTALRDQPGYDHPVVISCPSNQTADKLREVTYPLRRRHLRFTATVRPYYRLPADRPSVTWVVAIVNIKQPDGTVRTEVRGQQKTATMDRPAQLDADVEGADELTVRVQCDSPDGVVVLVDGTLTPYS